MRKRFLTFLLTVAAVFAVGAGDVSRNPWPSTVYGSMIVDSFTPFDVIKGLVGWWHFNEGDGSHPTAIDYSGEGNDGTLTNMNTSDWEVHNNGYAVDLDGSNNYIEVTDSAALRGMSELSVSVWLYVDTKGDWEKVIDYASDTTENTARKYRLQFNADADQDLTFSIWDTTGTGQLIGNLIYNAFPTGEWIHLVVTYDGTTDSDAGIMYANNSSVATAEGRGNAVSNTDGGDFMVGFNQATSAQYFDGTINDLRVYDRALSAAEVEALYNGEW